MGEWKKVRIGEFLTESKEEAINSDSSRRITVRLNCRGVEHRKLKAEKDGATKYYIRHAGQFIYGKQNIHKGAFGIIPKELEGFTSSADLPAFDFINDLCFPEFLNLWLQVDERYKALQKNVKGAGSQRLAVSAFLDEGISLPDLPTQKQIVKRISENLKRVNELAKEIETQKGYVKLLRRNILQDAIEGKLTADWRKDYPVQKGNPDYDAEALFELIQKERKVYKKWKALSPILDAEKPFELPTGWKWVRLGEICNSITDGDHLPPPKQPSGIPFVVISDISSGKIHFKNGRFVSEDYFNKLSSEKIPETGDILYTVTGSYGIPVPVNDSQFCVQRHIGIIKPVHLIKDFLFFSLMSPICKKQADRVAWGVAVKTIPIKELRNFMIPLSPLAEQQKIVGIVSIMFDIVSKLEQIIQERKILSERLISGIIRENLEEEGNVKS